MFSLSFFFLQTTKPILGVNLDPCMYKFVKNFEISEIVKYIFKILIVKIHFHLFLKNITNSKWVKMNFIMSGLMNIDDSDQILNFYFLDFGKILTSLSSS